MEMFDRGPIGSLALRIRTVGLLPRHLQHSVRCPLYKGFPGDPAGPVLPITLVRLPKGDLAVFRLKVIRPISCPGLEG
ncbi:unnamed protein product, partial [Nesidiocoris tenuis]